MTQPGIDLHLIGMQNRALVRANIDIAANGITDKEKEVLEEVFKRFFKPSDKRHWENIELEQFKKDMVRLGKWPA